jgi:hypothetical protein
MMYTKGVKTYVHKLIKNHKLFIYFDFLFTFSWIGIFKYT